MAKTLTPVTADAVREWARGKGLEVGTRGRLSEDLIARFNKAYRLAGKVYTDPARSAE